MPLNTFTSAKESVTTPFSMFLPTKPPVSLLPLKSPLAEEFIIRPLRLLPTKPPVPLPPFMSMFLKLILDSLPPVEQGREGSESKMHST